MKVRSEETGTRFSVVSAAAPSIRLFAPGTEVAARYEVRSVLGHGGSAVVYEAFDRELKRVVALKVLRGDRASEAATKRFRREVAVARDAASPHLVRVFDIGAAGETVFLTMELVVGESLRDRLEAGPLPVADALRIGAEVLRALVVLHGLGIVHRDVKPGNILLDGDGRVKLADFGLARRWDGTETRATETEGLVGTAEYLSPEQALGKEVDARTDLYAFGVVLFEMLAGVVPLRGDSAIGTILAHVKETPRDVRKLRSDVAPWLAGLVARLLAKDPRERYATAAEVLADLEAGRVTVGAQARRLRFLAAAGAAALAVAAGIVLVARPFAPRFERLVTARTDGLRETGVAALDRKGRVLWSRDDTHVGVQTALARKDGRLRVAAVLGAARPPSGDGPRRTDLFQLSFLDPDSGTVLERVSLPSAASSFSAFSPDFVPYAMLAADLDGDGTDEVAVTYVHALYWPSFTVLYEPAEGRSRVVFVAAGHHRVRAAADLDGDGRKELIFSGPNNRMGWYTGFAAVRVPPRGTAGRQERGLETSTPARTPETSFGSATTQNLLWYALGPRFDGEEDLGREIQWDETRRLLFARRRNGPPYLLTAEGLRLVDGAAGYAVRAAARDHALRLLESAQQSADGGFPEAAATAGLHAASEAEAASEPFLAEWSRRLSARSLARAGKEEAAERLLSELCASSTLPAGIAFEGAQAFHLAGRLGAALRWIERALADSPAMNGGRPPNDFVTEAVLALVEAGRLAEARAVVSGYATRFPAIANQVAPLRWYVGWRRGDRSSPWARPSPIDPDEARYWWLECRLASGESPGALAREVAEERAKASETTPLLDGLAAELALRQGRREEALSEARRAFDATREGAQRSTLLRAHLDVVAGRYARAGEANGKADDAREARAELARLAHERRGASR
ncbi:MAG: protein kinase [Thermoanaerobaculia bacterium]